MIVFYDPDDWPLAYSPLQSPVGLLPAFFNAKDPRPARAQLEERYLGAFMPVSGGRIEPGPPYHLTFPGEKARELQAYALLGHETLMVFEGSWLAIIQQDGRFQVGQVE